MNTRRKVGCCLFAAAAAVGGFAETTLDCERFFSALPGLEVAPVPDQVFDGIHPGRPNFVVRDKRDPLLTPLTEGTDYTVTITGNDQLGLAQALIQGVNSYEGMAVSTSFRMISESTLPPEGYVRLSSLTTDGQQYFATGFTPDATTIVTNCQFCYTKKPTEWDDWGCLFGGAFGANGFILMYQNTGLNWWGGCERIYDADPVGHEMDFSIGPAGNDTRTATLIIDGVETNVVTELNTKQSGELYFFAAQGQGPQFYAPVRFYRTTFVKGGEVARDFVPVLRLADNRVGVYDLANNVFYVNQGTAADFQAGLGVTANLVLSPVADAVTDPEHPYRPTVTVTREGSEEPLTEGVDYQLVWPETKSGIVYLYAIGLGQLKGAHGATSYRQFVAEPVDEWLSSTASPSFTTNIGQRLVYVFDYTDGGKVLVSTRQTMTLGEALIVGGGGAGGWTIGGGGGGGGVRALTCSQLLSAGQSLSLTIGAGGKLDPGTTWQVGYEGEASRVEIGETSYVALGGGGGGQYLSAPTATGNLASAGGYGDEYTTPDYTDGVHYTSSQGYPGGKSSARGAAGGGGAGEPGGDGVNGQSGKGGEGILSSICGYPVFQGYRAVYGSGGGGGAGNDALTPGQGGTNAGAGAVRNNGNVRGGSAVNGFGGGGGGGGFWTATRGGAGGHGRIVLSFFAGDTSGKMLAVEPLSNTLASRPKPRVYDPSHPTKVLREGVDFRYEYQTNNPKATKEDPGQGVVVAVGLGDYAGVSADTWYDSYRGAGLILIVQ